MKKETDSKRERERQKLRAENERKTERQERKRGVFSYSLCLWSKNKKAAAAKHVYELVYMSKTAQREKTHKRDQRL